MLVVAPLFSQVQFTSASFKLYYKSDTLTYNQDAASTNMGNLDLMTTFPSYHAKHIIFVWKYHVFVQNPCPRLGWRWSASQDLIDLIIGNYITDRWSQQLHWSWSSWNILLDVELLMKAWFLMYAIGWYTHPDIRTKGSIMNLPAAGFISHPAFDFEVDPWVIYKGRSETKSYNRHHARSNHGIPCILPRGLFLR